MITLAKGLTSAYAPLSVAAISKKLGDVFKQAALEVGVYSHGYTYSGHPICAAAGLKAIEITLREDIPTLAKEQGAYLLKRLKEEFEAFDFVGDIRGVGLMVAIEFTADKAKRIPNKTPIAPTIAACMLKKGVIVRAMPNGDILGFSPPLIISKDEIEQVISVVKSAFSEFIKSR